MTTEKILSDIAAERVDESSSEAVEQSESHESGDIEEASDTNAQEVEQPQETEEKAQHKDVWPSSAVNTFKRLKREKKELQALIDELRSKNEASQAPKEPKENDYESYSDFLEAKMMHKVKEELAAREKASQNNMQQAEQQRYMQERLQSIAEKNAEYAQKIPDYAEVMNQVSGFIDDMPEHVRMSLIESDDAAIAVYNLAKSGQLFELENVNPYKAAMIIASAQTAQKAVPQKSPPPPVKGVKGGASIQSEDSLSGSDLLKKYGLK